MEILKTLFPRPKSYLQLGSAERMRSRFSLLLVVTALAAGGAVLAQNPPESAQDPAADLPPIAQTVLDSSINAELAQLPGVPLSLEEALALGAVRATAVVSAQAATAAARGRARSEKGSLNPELFGEGSYRDDQTRAANFFAGADVLETQEGNASAGARWTLPVGTELSAALGTVKRETNSIFALLTPEYSSFGELRVSQPLLEGLGVGTSGRLDAARHEVEAADARLEETRLGTDAQVEATYWELYALGRDYTVQRLIRDRAASLVREAETRVRAGLAGPGDVANAQVFQASQELTLLASYEALGDASDRLAALIGQRPTGGEVIFKPTDLPPEDFPVPDAEALVAAAAAANFQLASLERDLAGVRALYLQARRNALPSLDVFGALGGTGLTGTGREVEFNGEIYNTTIEGGAGESLGQVFSGDYPNWQVGLLFAVPIGNDTDGGERDRLAADVVRAEQAYEDGRRNLEVQVRTGHRILQNHQRRLEVTRQGVTAASELVRIGILEYEAGRTSAFELVRLGGDLATAQRLYSGALVFTARAAAALKQLTGGAYPDDLNEGTGP